MASLVHRVKNFVVYLDHDDIIATLNWDDIVANPISALIRVLSPKKVIIIQKEGEKLLEFYADIKKKFVSEVEAHG